MELVNGMFFKSLLLILSRTIRSIWIRLRSKCTLNWLSNPLSMCRKKICRKTGYTYSSEYAAQQKLAKIEYFKKSKSS